MDIFNYYEILGKSSVITFIRRNCNNFDCMQISIRSRFLQLSNEAPVDEIYFHELTPATTIG